MSLALYMDVNVPAAITRALRRHGVDVLTAQEDGAAQMVDPALLDRVAEVGRVVFTRDSDFLAEGVRWSTSRTPLCYDRLCASTARFHWPVRERSGDDCVGVYSR